MATGTTTTSSSVSTITGYCVVAEARFGSNGAAPGTPEVSVGSGGTDVLQTSRVWDSVPADGIDSGPVAVLASAEKDGGANGVSWYVAGAAVAPLVYVGRTYGAISKVVVRAAVRVNGQAEWSELQVRFFRLGRQTDSYVLASGPAVDTTAGPGATAESVLTVTPGLGTNTKVTVSGYVRLACGEEVVPGPGDLFAQVYVYADSCAPSV